MKYACRMAAALIALVAAPALLAEDKPAGPPKPASEMSQLAYLDGTWHCSGKTFATPIGAEHATEGVAHAQTALGGFRLVIHYDETKTAAEPDAVPPPPGHRLGFGPEGVRLRLLRRRSAGRARRPRPAGRGTSSSSKGTP